MEVDEGSIGEHLGREQIGDQEETYWAEGTGKEKKNRVKALFSLFPVWFQVFQADPPGDQHVEGTDQTRPLLLLFDEAHLGLQVLCRNAHHLICGHVRCDAVVVLRKD